MILSALHNYYQRLVSHHEEGIASFGFSQEKISYALILSQDGKLLDVQDIRDNRGKKPVPAILTVPQPPKRSANIAPCFLWDKSSYVLGVSVADDERSKKRNKETHQSFKDMHKELLAKCNSSRLEALLTFLDRWEPDAWQESGLLSEDMLDANYVFRLDGDLEYMHQYPEAQKIRLAMLQQSGARSEACLVTGKHAPVALLHPSIKGVYGAQTAGASIVSFNLDAFTSYGKSQGENAPISEEATFAYTTTLNHLLRKGSRQRLQLGDASVVFWAESGTMEGSHAVEGLFANLLNPPVTDSSESDRLRSVLDLIAKGRPLKSLNPDLEDDTAIYVLGLAPNASRLSVRFWETGSLHSFAERLAQHYRDLELRPLPWKTEASVWRLLLETVPHRAGSQPKSDDIPPQLAGEMIRAILTGLRYPASLLSNLIMRMRADGDISPLRVALCKAVLVRDARISNKTTQKEIPMGLDLENTDPGYLLGRLFATLENIQQSALGRDINATIRDRYYGAGSATPASIFPVLVRNAQHHLSRLRKDRPGAAVNLEKQINEIVDKLPPSFPKSLRIEAQGRFAIGYYHQSKARFSNQETDSNEGED
ncbi:MAG: type I-C CRISPR-associated protein Cas8c/Csd1 [Pseudomonadales bacterium]|nr:type I-C CRISPR-associated protein Cas8c/Csd1 [Pseudomonadales bacterium]